MICVSTFLIRSLVGVPAVVDRMMNIVLRWGGCHWDYCSSEFATWYARPKCPDITVKEASVDGDDWLRIVRGARKDLLPRFQALGARVHTRDTRHA